MSFVTSLWQLPFLPFFICMVAIVLWLVAFIQRMLAAAINDRSHSFSADGKTTRRFGLGPRNKYLFFGQRGWERIISYDYQLNRYITDGYDREARLKFEVMQRGFRRRQAVLPLGILVLLCLILRVVILPAPLDVLLHPLANDNYLLGGAYAFNNVKMLVDYVIGANIRAKIGGWDALIALFILVWLPLCLIFSVGRIIANAYNIFTFAFVECLYLAGYQNMQGAKVFDAPPGDRPLRDQPGLLERLRLNLKHWWAQRRRKRAPDAEEASADGSQQRSGTGDQRTRSEDARSQKEQAWQAGRKASAEDAYAYFGLPANCSKQEFLEVYRAVIKRHNPDQQGDMPEAVRRQAEEIMKTANVMRDLIYKARGWR